MLLVREQSPWVQKVSKDGDKFVTLRISISEAQSRSGHAIAPKVHEIGHSWENLDRRCPASP